MINFRFFLTAGLLAGVVLAMPLSRAAAQDGQGAVFVMTNAASDNQIYAYIRRADGSLESSGSFATGGNGSGGTLDPLHSQRSLTLSADHRLLFAVNAGSGTVSSFAADGASLTQLDTEGADGSSPISITQAGDLDYVLNSGGNGSVSGFHILGNGHLRPIKDSTHNLSGTAPAPTDVALSPNGQFLVVAESAANMIDVFRVYPNGTLSDVVADPSASALPFDVAFTPSGALIVDGTSNSIYSYQIKWNQSLQTITGALPTEGLGSCWSVILPNGRFVYTDNAGTSNQSGFAIGANGSLTQMGNAIVSSNPDNSTNLDIGVSSDGRFLYTLNAATGSIGMFSVQSDGGLVKFGQFDGLPASAGLNGIAAY
jgi:6-phosphogluconolactonase (cycloisomerase 2 family)